MGVPLAAIRPADRGEFLSKDVAGMTLSSAPESIRNCRPEFLSKIDIDDDDDEPAAFIDDRLWRFPTPASARSGSSSDNGKIYTRKP